jgi:steroid delta-isomerase-like uncharacterized protein
MDTRRREVEVMMTIVVGADGEITLPEYIQTMYRLKAGAELLVAPIDQERFEVRVLPSRLSVSALAEKYAMDGPAPDLAVEREALGDALAAEFERETLERVARRWIVEGWQRGDADAVLAMYALDFVDLGAPNGRPSTRDENVAGIRSLYTAFPDFHATIDELVIDESAASVTIRWSAVGTHRGPFFGVAPTGREIIFRGIEILLIRDGWIVQRSGEWDAYGLLRQLGVVG